MEISDIIKTEEDRLFIVDPECYIIFTGTNTEDDKPFIRLGNWIDLPVELIPLIENIVITDTMIGNPSGEQFNIDIRYLSSNRYIGSKNVVKRYLEFQKLFGLDLTNASIIDIEKDIPELSLEKNLSEKNHFIGVFYRDGNFKTVHTSATIIDLKEINKKYKNFVGLHDLVSERTSSETRFSGTGVVIVGHNPMFFSNKAFTSYLFPTSYLSIFSRLGIDPGMVRELIYPSASLLNVTKFLKWKNSNQTSVTILSNYGNLIKSVKSLFPHAVIKQLGFRGAHQCSGNKKVAIFPDSYNIRITLRSPSKKELNIAYFKVARGIKKIIKSKLDAIFVTYSAYEDTNLLFRSSTIPFAIIDDGNKNVSKLAGSDVIILNQGIHYEIELHQNIESIYSRLNIPRELIPPQSDYSQWITTISQLIATNEETLSRQITLFNISMILNLLISTTKDRNLSLKCKDLLKQLKRTLRNQTLFTNSSQVIVHLIFFNNLIYQGATEYVQKMGPAVFDEVIESEKDLYRGTALEEYFTRIINDRERLKMLLALYTKSDRYINDHKEKVRLLKKEIEKRKSITLTSDVVLDEDYEKVMFQGKASDLFIPDAKDSNDRIDGIEDDQTKKKSDRRITLKRVSILSLLLALLIAAALGIVKKMGYFDHETLIPEKKLERKLTNQDRIDYEKKYNIVINNRDIFFYANRVAVKNGYNPLPLHTLKTGKNPDWIYPANIFRMTDGEVVVVKDGDTLWDLSRDKLVRFTVQIHQLIEKSKTSEGSEKKAVLDRAKAIAITETQNKIIDKFIKSLEPGDDKRNK